MSYLQFHLIFILPPMLLLALALGRPARLGRFAWLGIPVLAVVALVYTTPWDNYLVFRGVWGYGEERVIGTIGYVPVEEYAFFVLQTFLTGLWLYNLLLREDEPLVREPRPLVRWGGTLFWVALTLAGAWMLRTDAGFYLGLVLVWAGPVLAGQWAYGGEVLWRRRRTWALGVAVPTAYLCLADRLAIGLDIWAISPRYTTGIEPFGLPLEEAVFFMMTNLMVVGGLMLFLWVIGRMEERAARSPRTERTSSAALPPPRGVSAGPRRGAPVRVTRRRERRLGGSGGPL